MGGASPQDLQSGMGLGSARGVYSVRLVSRSTISTSASTRSGIASPIEGRTPAEPLDRILAVFPRLASTVCDLVVEVLSGDMGGIQISGMGFGTSGRGRSLSDDGRNKCSFGLPTDAIGGRSCINGFRKDALRSGGRETFDRRSNY